MTALNKIKAALANLASPMDRAVLQMPMELAFAGDLAQMQYHQRAQSLLARIDALNLEELLAYVESLEAKAARSESAAAAFEREQDRADAAEIRAELAEKDAARAKKCALKYLDYLGIKNAQQGLAQDMLDPEMVGNELAAMEQTK